jgi:AraC family transcriptional regulator
MRTTMTETGANYEDRLNRVTAYIYDHLDGELDFATLAEVAALSPYHWHRIYHAVRGETAVATARRLRLQRAAVDLAGSAKSIEEIAARAGYGGVQAFTRAFSDSYGLPPARYREEGSHRDFKPGVLEAPRASWRIEIRHIPPTSLLSVDHVGSYMDIGRAFETLFGRAGAQGPLSPQTRMIGVYYDDPPRPSRRKNSAPARLSSRRRMPRPPRHCDALRRRPANMPCCVTGAPMSLCARPISGCSGPGCRNRAGTPPTRLSWKNISTIPATRRPRTC